MSEACNFSVLLDVTASLRLFGGPHAICWLLPHHQKLVADIEQACKNGVPLGSACTELGLSARTVARWRRTGEVRADARPTAPRPAPAHKLSEQERQRMLDVCREARFADLPPAQIMPRLADEGT